MSRTGILPIIKLVSERITHLEHDTNMNEATRVTARAELEVIKRRLMELRAFLAHESAEQGSATEIIE